MKLSCPACFNTVADAKSIWKYDFSELVQCKHCGLVYHIRNDELFLKQAHHTYTKDSWGKSSDYDYDLYMNSAEMTQHVNRMINNLDFFSKHINIENKQNVLDIGAGIGLLEFAIKKTNSALVNCNLVLLEPVSEMCTILRERYPDNIIINANLNQIKDTTPMFDFIFCQGVDYLFGDILGAFQILHRLLKPDGVLLISRNVFIDMPCYFGGNHIKTAKELFTPNQLINAYFVEEHYRLMLEKNFYLIAAYEHKEDYGDASLATGVHFNYVLKKKNELFDLSPVSSAVYKPEYDQALKRLFECTK